MVCVTGVLTLDNFNSDFQPDEVCILWWHTYTSISQVILEIKEYRLTVKWRSHQRSVERIRRQRLNPVGLWLQENVNGVIPFPSLDQIVWAAFKTFKISCFSDQSSTIETSFHSWCFDNWNTQRNNYDTLVVLSKKIYLFSWITGGLHNWFDISRRYWFSRPVLRQTTLL